MNEIITPLLCLGIAGINMGLALNSPGAGIALFSFGVAICTMIDRVSRR